MANYVLDWNEYSGVAKQAIAEGCVLLENHNNVLPLEKGSKVSVFGRIQNYYYKSGTGSGGMVNVSKVVSIPEGLRNSGVVTLNEELAKIYAEWEKENPVDEGEGWGSEPWCQQEMELSEEVAAAAAKNSDVAIVIIGRTAGEDRDAGDAPGSYRLTDIEERMIANVRAAFEKVIVLLNVGSIMDMSFIDKYNPDAVMYVWQGGMLGGDGTADVLTGKVSPCGKLTDTIAYKIEDYPSNDNFGNPDFDLYCEDIYVGYRYFETVAKDRVRYPFGYGISYTDFSIEAEKTENKPEEKTVCVSLRVTNTGSRSGKEVVQVYVQAPQGKLGKPLRSLVAYKKTNELKPGESQVLDFCINYNDAASYDDLGITGYRFCTVLEQGKYLLYAGSDVRSAEQVAGWEITETTLVEQLTSALTPVKEFQCMVPCEDGNGGYTMGYRIVYHKEADEELRRAEYMPEEIPQNFETDYKLSDVLENKISMEQFIAQLTDDDLTCIVRGEGMGSSKVTPGTAAAFGGVSPHLVELGIPAVCCDDGPSGMRLDSGAKAFSLPNGTMLACTFNDELVEELYSYTSMEMIGNKVECLLGPGMNIHRHPLNGRNFEYFSEDPYLTGSMAGAMLKGLQKYGVTGTAKHFCGNNQERRRHFIDSVISERALREIYLKGFEMIVRSGVADSIMTTYGSVNGVWTAGNFDLATTILRKDWGYTGIVMTDWWAAINERNKPSNLTNFAAMVRSQNDLYMVCPDGATNASNDNTMEALQNGLLCRSELQRSAINTCRFAMKTEAMKRLLGKGSEVEVINRPKDESEISLEGVEFVTLDGSLTVMLNDKPSAASANYIIPLDVVKQGLYKISLYGKSSLSRLAQMPCTLFNTGIPVAIFSFNGTNGEIVSIDRQVELFSRFSTMRLYVSRAGLELEKICFTYIGEGDFISGNRN
ncbi:MAG: glycoside hydrolase family 3 protein [Lachnospiraceae bacterium]